MAKWGWTQYLGARGEHELLASLLSTGSAINSLTEADSGWDLHLHLPKEPIFVDAQDEELDNLDLRDLKWDLSGRSVHIQVKRTSTSNPRVGLGTLRGWLAGSTAGTPTFLFWTEHLRNPITRFATPASLRLWLDNYVTATEDWVRTPIDSRLGLFAYDPKRFSLVADIWSRYAAVLIDAPEIDKVISSGVRLVDAGERSAACAWAAGLIAGSFGYDSVLFDYDGNWHQMADDMIRWTLEGLFSNGITNEEVELAKAEISDEAIHGRTSWRGRGFAAGTFYREHNGLTASDALKRMTYEFQKVVSSVRAPSPW